MPASAMLFGLLWPTARSIVGGSPFSGRLVTDQGRTFSAQAVKSATPLRRWYAAVSARPSASA